MQQCQILPFRASSGSSAMMLAGIVMSMVLGPSTARILLPPKAGDLVTQVKDKLANDHRTLGKVSAALMSVQSQVDKTEQSMLGKVLDLQTARSFFSRHEQIDSANGKMKLDITKLNKQVEGLSSTLSKVQRDFLKSASKNSGTEGLLHTQIVQNKALMGAMQVELAKGPTVKETLVKLSKIHKDLMVESVNVSETGKTAVAMLQGFRQRSCGEVGRHKSLRAQLVAMNNYSISCHTAVSKASKKLGVVMIADSKDNQANLVAMRQQGKADEASEQRLLAERALLVSETKKMETKESMEVNRLKDLRGDLKLLEGNIVSEVRALEAKINAEKERVKGLSTDLMANSQAEMEHSAQKDAIEAKLDTLMKEVHQSENPVLIATTEAQNEALHAELQEAYRLWKDAKKQETAALLNVDQSSSSAAAAKEGLKIASEAVVSAQAEGRKRVVLAVKKAAKSKAKSMILIQKAEAAVAGRCKPKWDAIWKRKRAKLVKCKSLKSDLAMEKAKKETLLQTLKAKAESS